MTIDTHVSRLRDARPCVLLECIQLWRKVIKCKDCKRNILVRRNELLFGVMYHTVTYEIEDVFESHGELSYKVSNGKDHSRHELLKVKKSKGIVYR